MMSASVIIVAGGKGKRMGTPVSKQYLLLNGLPILCHTINSFNVMDEIDEIILVVPSSDIIYCKENIIAKLSDTKKINIVQGGKQRQNSVFNGLAVLKNKGPENIVLIHDGVRPFIQKDQIIQCINKTMQYDACMLGIPAIDTLKSVDLNFFITDTLNRESIWQAQTPQAFKYKIIYKAHQNAISQNHIETDDAAIVEKLNYKILMVQGSKYNIKITTKEDLVFAEAIYKILKKN